MTVWAGLVSFISELGWSMSRHARLSSSFPFPQWSFSPVSYTRDDHQLLYGYWSCWNLISERTSRYGLCFSITLTYFCLSFDSFYHHQPSQYWTDLGNTTEPCSQQWGFRLHSTFSLSRIALWERYYCCQVFVSLTWRLLVFLTPRYRVPYTNQGLF